MQEHSLFSTSSPVFTVCRHFDEDHPVWGDISLYFFFNWRLITLQYCGGFCHTLTWVSHGWTCVPHPEPPSHLPPHPIPLGCPSAPALSALFHASNLDWWSISHMVIYMFQCYSLKSSHPHLLPQNPKVFFISVLEEQNLNQWTTREVPIETYFNSSTY